MFLYAHTFIYTVRIGQSDYPLFYILLTDDGRIKRGCGLFFITSDFHRVNEGMSKIIV